VVQKILDNKNKIKQAKKAKSIQNLLSALNKDLPFEHQFKDVNELIEELSEIIEDNESSDEQIDSAEALINQINSFLVFFLISVTAVAQNGTISGKVADSNSGEVIPGAKISIEGMSKGAMTDLDGLFTIQQLPEGKYSLNVSYYQYNSKIITDIIVKKDEVTNVNVSIDKVVKAGKNLFSRNPHPWSTLI
jgi:hypothetical protein